MTAAVTAGGETGRPRVLLVVVCALCALAVLVTWRGRREGGVHSPGEPCPPFAATTLDGKVIDLESLRGRVVLIDFWATWCSPCLKELPAVVALHADHADEGFEILGISLDSDLDRLLDFLDVNPQVAWPQVCDGKAWDGDLVELFSVDSIPRTFLLDRQGRILAVGLRGRELARAVSGAL